MKLLKNEEAAQDLAQDTYLRAMEHIDTLKEAEAFPGWIKRICVNLCKNHLTVKRPLLFGDDKQDFLLSQEPEVQEDFLPHVYADKMETCRLIDRMVDALPDKLRAAVVLYYYDELTVAQIADFLQVGENTVKSRLNYARA